jgi:hypothetical protein
VIAFINNLLDGCFPFLKTHRLFLFDFSIARYLFQCQHEFSIDLLEQFCFVRVNLDEHPISLAKTGFTSSLRTSTVHGLLLPPMKESTRAVTPAARDPAPHPIASLGSAISEVRPSGLRIASPSAAAQIPHVRTPIPVPMASTAKMRAKRRPTFGLMMHHRRRATTSKPNKRAEAAEIMSVSIWFCSVVSMAVVLSAKGGKQSKPYPHFPAQWRAFHAQRPLGVSSFPSRKSKNDVPTNAAHTSNTSVAS